MKRKAYHEGRLLAEAKKLQNQARFIQELMDNEIVIWNRPIAEILQTLRERNYDPDPLAEWEGRQKQQAEDEDTDGGCAAYDYLLDMPIEHVLIGTGQILEDPETQSEGAPEVDWGAKEALEDAGRDCKPKNTEDGVEAASGAEGDRENQAPVPKAPRKRAANKTGEKKMGTSKKCRKGWSESDLSDDQLTMSFGDDEERSVIPPERQTSRRAALARPKPLTKRLSGGTQSSENTFNSLFGASESAEGSSSAGGSKAAAAPRKSADSGSGSKPSSRLAPPKPAPKKALSKKKPVQSDSDASDTDEEKPKPKKTAAARKPSAPKKKPARSDSDMSGLGNFKPKKAVPTRKPAAPRRPRKGADSGVAPKKAKPVKKALPSDDDSTNAS